MPCVDSPPTVALRVISELVGDARRTPRNPAVNMVCERRGTAHAMITAVIMPRPVIKSRNQCWRQRQSASVTTEVTRWRPVGGCKVLVARFILPLCEITTTIYCKRFHQESGQQGNRKGLVKIPRIFL